MTRWPVLLVVAALGAGCAGDPPVTREEAAAGVQQRLDASAEALFPDARLERVGPATDRICGDFWAEVAETAEYDSYVVRDVPRDRYGPLLARARDHWRGLGYRVVRQQTDAAGRVARLAVVDAQDFTLRLRDERTHLVLSAASPCLPVADPGGATRPE